MNMDTIKIKIKESWDEVSIEDYIKLSKIKDGNLIDIMELLTNIDRDKLNTIDTDEVDVISQHLGWVNILPSAENLTEVFKVGGDEYRYERGWNKLNLGEVVTFEMLVERNKLTQLETIPLYLAIVLRKVLKDGTVEEWNADIVSERVAIFEKELNIAEVMGIFFCLTHNGQTPIEHLTSSMVELRALRDEIMKM